MPENTYEIEQICYWTKVLERAEKLGLTGAVKEAKVRLDQAYDDLDSADRAWAY